MYRFIVDGYYKFEDFPDSIQYRVLVDFFDSVWI